MTDGPDADGVPERRSDQEADGVSRAAKLIARILGGGFGGQSTLLLTVRVGGSALMFVFHVLLGRLLGSDGYGVVSYVIGLAEFGMVFALVGYNRVILKYVAVYHGRQDWYGLTRLLRFCRHRMLLYAMITGFVILLYHIWWARGRAVVGGVAAAVAVALLITMVAIEFQQRVLQGIRQAVRGALPHQVLRPIAGVVIVVFLWHLGALQPVSAAAAYMGACAMVVVVTHVVLARSLSGNGGHGSETRSDDRDLWIRMSRYMFLVGIATTLGNRANVLLLGNMSTAVEVGFYAAGAKIATLLNMIVASISVVVSPRIARSADTNDDEALRRVYRRSVKWTAVLVVPFGITAAVLGRPILGIYGSDFVDAYPAFLLLLVGQMVFALIGPTGTVMQMAGLERSLLKIKWVAAPVGILTSILLIPTMGAVGAAIGAMVTIVILSMLVLYVLQKEFAILRSPST